MSQVNIRRLILAGLAISLASVGAYLDVHGQSGWLPWAGAIFCFLEVL